MTTAASSESGTAEASKGGLIGKIFGQKPKIRKAKMGQEMQMYYNEELKCWVMPGEEAEKRREVEALRAPPVIPSGSGAPSAVSGVGGDGSVNSSGNDRATGTNATGSRSSNPLASRYAAMPTMSVRDGQSEAQQSVLAGLKPPPVGYLGGGFEMGRPGLGQFQPMQPFKPAVASSDGGGKAGHQNVWQQQRMKQQEDSDKLEESREGAPEDRGTVADYARQSLERDRLDHDPAPAEIGEHGGNIGFDGYDANGEQSYSHGAKLTAMDPFVLEVLSFWSYYRTAGYELEAMMEWVAENYGEDVAGELDCEALLMDALVIEAVEAYKATHMNEDVPLDGGYDEPSAGVDGNGQLDGMQDLGPEVGGDDEYQAYGGTMAGFGGADAEGGYHGAEVAPEMAPEAGVEVPSAVQARTENADYQPQAHQHPGQEYGYETPAGVLSPADHHHSRPKEHNLMQQPEYQLEHEYDAQPEEQQVSYLENAMYDQIAGDLATGGAPGESQQMSLDDRGPEGDGHAVDRVDEVHRTPTASPNRLTESSNLTTPTTIKLQTIAMQDHLHMESHLLKVIDGHAATIQGLTAKLEAAMEEASSGKIQIEDQDEELRKLRAELDQLAEAHAKGAAEAAEAEAAARKAADASQAAASDLEMRLEEAQAEMTAVEAARNVLETEKEAREQRAIDLENDVLALRDQVVALEEQKAELAQMAEGAGHDRDVFNQQQQDLVKIRMERDELSAEANRLLEALAASEAVAAANVAESSGDQTLEIEELLKKMSLLEEEKCTMQDEFQNMLDERDAEIMQLEARVMLSESAVQSAKDEARDALIEETRRQLLEEMAGEKEQQMMRLCELEALAEGKDAEVANAEERIRELERKFALAKKKIHAQTSQVERLTAERQEVLDRGQPTGQLDDEAMNELAAENTELKANIDALESRINEAETTHEQEIGNLMKENDQLMDALSEKEDHLEMIVTELAQLRSEAETNRNACDEISRMSDELEGLRNAVAVAEAALQEERASRETFRTHVEAEELRLYDQIRELEDQVSFLKETLGDAEEAARVATEEAQEARSAAEEARAAAAESEGLHSAEAISAAVDDATRDLTALLAEKAAELAALNESLDIERTDRSATEENLRQQVAQLEEQFSFLEESASAAQQTLMEERGAKDMASAQCTELSERMQVMLAKLGEAEQAAQDACDDARGLREEMDRISQISDAREAEIAQLKATLADYESSLLDANETLENAQRDIAELTELVECNGVGGGETPGDGRAEELEREISSLKHQLASLSESASNHQDDLRKYKLQLVKAKKLRAADQEKIEELQNSVDELNNAVAVAMSTAGPARASDDGNDHTAELDAINQELESSLTDALTALGQEEAKVVRLMELLNVAGLTEDEIQVELDTVAEQVGFGGDDGDNDLL
jgi:chromosome segregation ATPase